MTPSTAHFIWFGASFPWLNVLAVRSAALRGGFERVVLHHDSDLTRTPHWDELTALPSFESRRVDVAALFEAAGCDWLNETYAALKAPAARANVLRAALLAAEGGVYLDLDTVTLGSFDELRASGDFFCGEEPIAYPVETLTSRNPLRWGRALALDGARDLCRRLPAGWRRFRTLEPLYHRAVNNAVVGAPAGHPLLSRLLTAMAEVPEERRLVRYELGTSLLQREVAAWRGGGLRVLPPEVFYPLGPEVSEHWFRKTSEPAYDQIVGPTTLVVHWYASVRTGSVVPRYDATWVREHAGSELLAALVVQAGLLAPATAAAGEAS